MDFFSKPKKRHVGRIWAPYEPCPAKIGDPGGVLPPHIVKKCFFGDIKMVYLLPNFTWRENFFSLSQRKLVGKIWCPYEPFPANIEGPRGGKYPQIGTKTTIFERKSTV